MRKNVFLTGTPGVGKTTLITSLIEKLPQDGVSGFYTQDVMVGEVREGFKAITLDGIEIALANIGMKSSYRVGKYRVNITAFEELVVPVIDPRIMSSSDLIIVDEVGKMECLSNRFRKTLKRLLDSDQITLGTIALWGDEYIESVKKRRDVEIMEVTLENRDSLLASLKEEYCRR